jgi:DNA (cytosine-5)-methyltransferase 1
VRGDSSEITFEEKLRTFHGSLAASDYLRRAPDDRVFTGNAEGKVGNPTLTTNNLGRGVNNQTPILAYKQAHTASIRTREEGPVLEIGGTVAACLRASQGGSDKPMIVVPTAPGVWRVRRITPVEAERLMGMPDDYTLIPDGKRLAADTPRYRAIGNSIVVPCLRWLGRRIEAAHEAA